MRGWLPAVAALSLCVAAVTAADDGWSRFRGPNGQGVVESANVPVRWTDEDVLWSRELPGAGHSSPVVWKSRLFVTCSDSESAERRVVAVHLEDGRQLWSKGFSSNAYPQHRDNDFASSTPAVDAVGVYATWTTPEQVTLLALDHDGGELWRRDLGAFQSKFGSGGSPIVHEGLVILANDHMGESFLLAVDHRTGETRWRTPRRSGPTGYATPCILTEPDVAKRLLFLGTAHGVTALQPEDGKVSWELGGIAQNTERERPVASPVLAAGRIIGAYGMAGQGSQLFVVDPSRARGADRPRLAHRIERTAPYVPTPVARGDLLFVLRDNGSLLCHRLPGMELVWRERLRAGFYASPIRVGKRLYLVSKEGEVFVLAADEAYRLLAENHLGESSFATPAVVGDSLIFRTRSRLLRIGGGGRTSASRQER